MKNIILAIALNVLFVWIAFGEDTNELRVQTQYHTKIQDMVLSSENFKSGSGKVPKNAG